MRRFREWLRTWYHSFICNDNVRRRYPEMGLDERTRGSAWRAGRWFFNYGRRLLVKDGEIRGYDHPHTFELHWSWLRPNSTSIGVEFDAHEDNKVIVHVGVWMIGVIYVGHTVPARFLKWLLPWYDYTEGKSGGWPLSRMVDLSIHHGTVWFNWWVDPMNSDYGDYGKTTLPKWRSFNFSINPLDLLGHTRCKTEVVDPVHGVFIPLPEGEYLGMLTVERRTWTRKLWPWWPLKRVTTARYVEVPDGIPFSGKGENSWDCGEDGLFATGFDVREAGTDQKACCLYAASVLEMRVRRRDPRVWPVSPGVRARRIATMRAEREAAETASGEKTLDQETR